MGFRKKWLLLKIPDWNNLRNNKIMGIREKEAYLIFNQKIITKDKSLKSFSNHYWKQRNYNRTSIFKK